MIQFSDARQPRRARFKYHFMMTIFQRSYSLINQSTYTLINSLINSLINYLLCVASLGCRSGLYLILICSSQSGWCFHQNMNNVLVGNKVTTYWNLNRAICLTSPCISDSSKTSHSFVLPKLAGHQIWRELQMALF